MVIVTLCLTLSLLGSINTFSPGQEIVVSFQWTITAQKMKFSIKNFSSNCDQIRRRLRIWSHLLKKSLMENFIFCAVYVLWNLLLVIMIFFSFLELWKAFENAE